MKNFIRTLCILLIAQLFVCAHAETVPILDEVLFDSAKQTLLYFSAGDYESAAALVEIADADELEDFVTGNFTGLDEDVQTFVSVAFWRYNAWFIAVPLHDPIDGEIETIAFRSDDGITFSGYRYCTWAEIEEEYNQCDYVIWNEEYIPEGNVFIIE